MPFKCEEPAVPTVQRDDDGVRITRWDFAPGAATGWPTHGWPYFVVMLTDAVMKVEGVKSCDVNLVFDPPWDSSRMSDEAKLQLNMF